MKITPWMAVLVMVLGLTGIARADDATSAAAFYGRYQGTGVARDPNAMGYGFDRRDFDVEIGPANGGFFVAWTTVMRTTTGKETKRNNTRVVFEPSGRPGIFIQQAAAAGIADGFNWASITGKALTIHVLAILDDGTYEVQSYQRSLNKDGLYLVFRSDRNGALSKIVTAYLKKEAK